jgi:hypothetical protein
MAAPEPTAATIKVRCRAEGFADTLRQIAWMVGHRVSYEASDPDDAERAAYVLTDLDYAADEHILGELGLDIVRKIDGVLSLEVVPSKRREEPRAQRR